MSTCAVVSGESVPSGANAWLHALACVAGAIITFAASPHIDSGNVLMDVVQGLLAMGWGIILGGWWWCTCASRHLPITRWSLVLLTIASGIALASKLTQPVAMGLVGAMILWALLASRSPVPATFRFAIRSAPWNAVFFVLLIGTNIAADAAQLVAAPPGALSAASFVAERTFTHVAVISGTWIFLALYDRWAARPLRWVMTVVLMITPLLVVIDMILRLMWTKSIAQLCAEMEIGRNPNIRQILEGAGIDLGLKEMMVATVALGICYAIYALCHRWSRRAGWSASPWFFAKVAAVAWMLLVAAQAAQFTHMPPEWRQWQSRSSSLHLSPFTQPSGLVTFDVTFSNPAPPEEAALSRKPDIFFFIVETLRADALNKDIAPCMTELRDVHCQPLLDTRSAANATHLSWFGMLHGRLPVFWDEGRKRAAGSPLLSLLRRGGYTLEVRDGGTFDYLDMEATNFGDGTMASVFEHIPNIDPKRLLSTPEREVRVFDRLRASVTASTVGGHLWLTGVDSTHYPYAWHENWKPPFDDFDSNPIFPPLPSPEQIERIRHRYLNSVAWDDHMLGGFIDFLKQSGRFDESIIIITGDHGEEFKEHGSWFHCSAVNKEQTNVPLLIKWPKSWGRGAAFTDASHLDIAPSLLDGLGVPEALWNKLPGRSLLRGQEVTTIVATSQTGTRGEAMLWRRNGYEAAFSWSSPWLPVPPQKLWLERLAGPEGPIRFTAADDYEAELHRLFPDAFARIFDRCERAQ